jgi:hypothetical protein
MTTNSRIRTLSTVLALGAAAVSFSAFAQTASTTEPAKEGIGQRTEDAAKRAGHATANGARKVGHATSNGVKKVAGGVRHTGEKIGSKLPPAPRDENVNTTGAPRTTGQ